MKRGLFLAILLYSFLAARSQGNIEFADISFYQDSIDPLTIHVKCTVKSQLSGAFSMNGEMLNWGDGFQQNFYPLDTSYQYPGLVPSDPMKTYEAVHQYAAVYADSTVYIGVQMDDGLTNLIQNTSEADNSVISLCPIGVINFSYLSRHRGLLSAKWSPFTCPLGRYHRPFAFTPDIMCDSPYTFRVNISAPIGYYPNVYSPDVHRIDAYPISPNNITIFDSTTGALTWLTPWWTGGFMVSYQVSLYDRDTFVCSTTRDFVIDVLDSDYVFAGIDPVSVTAPSLRCYPSPSFGSFTIDMTGFDAGERQIVIYDQLGLVVYQSVSSQDRLQVTEPLPGGIYIVSVTQGAQRGYTRVLVE